MSLELVSYSSRVFDPTKAVVRDRFQSTQRHHGLTRNESELTRRQLLKEENVTHRIIGAFYCVYDRLGYGFVESVYQNALAHELLKRGLRVECEVSIEIWYDSVRVGHFRADMIVEGRVVIENKASVTLADADWKQLLNCLSASVYEIGLLLHFGPKAGFKRLLYDNERKAKRQSRERSQSSLVRVCP